MTELFQTILLRVTLAGLASALALAVTAESALREVVRVAAGLLMVLALVQPLTQVRLPLPKELFSTNAQAVREIETQNFETAMGSVGATIARVIEEHAAEEGIDCEVFVVMTTDEKGVLQTDSVRVEYRASDVDRLEELRTILTEDCGVPAERQELVQK